MREKLPKNWWKDEKPEKPPHPLAHVFTQYLGDADGVV